MKKFNFNQFFLNSILEMKTKGLARDLKLIKRIDPIRIKYKGKTLINLSSISSADSENLEFTNLYISEIFKLNFLTKCCACFYFSL